MLILLRTINGPVFVLDGHLKEPYEMSMLWEPEGSQPIQPTNQRTMATFLQFFLESGKISLPI